MTQQPDPGQQQHWERWLAALDAEIAAEDREDRRASARPSGSARIDLVAFEAFGEVGVMARHGMSKR